MNIEKRYSTAYHPSGNGIAERSVQIMKRTLAKLIDGCTEDWSLYLPITQLLINNRVSKALQSTPFSLFFARDMNAPITYTDKDGNIQRKEYLTHDEMLKRIDYMSQIVFPAIAERQQMVNDLRKGKVDKKNIQVNFTKGSYVMARVRDRHNALSPVYDGPYQVVRRNEGNAYILRDEEGMLISRNFTAEELKGISQDSVVPRSELYEIEAIIDDNGNSNNREYLVK
jgi:PAS domain-containing protein